MKTQEEIEQLASKKFTIKQFIGEDDYNRNETIAARCGYVDGYTQCQQDMADNWIKVDDIEKGFEQFYPNGEKCEFTAHAAAQICEVIFKNKINKQD